MKNNISGFTIIELLIVIAVVAILATIIYVGAAKQRENAKINVALQTAAGSQSIGHECFFRLKTIDQPDNARQPSNEICNGSQAVWPPINVEQCEYDMNTDEMEYEDGKYDKYIIKCDEFNKRVVCGVTTMNMGCEIEDIP